MVLLGFISRVKGFITSVQKDGANSIVFHVLFPILILNILLTSKIESSVVLIVFYVFIAFGFAMIVGKLLDKLTGKTYNHISHFMLTRCEGGNVALLLYTSIVGAKKGSGHTSVKELMKKIFSNSFVIAVILGLGLNFIGVYEMLSKSVFIDIYTNMISMTTALIVGMILFIIGYNLKLHMETIGSLLKLLVIILIVYACVVIWIG